MFDAATVRQTDPESYPVHLEIHPPARFTRAGLLLRLLVLVAVGFALHGWSGGLLGFVYFFLPVVAAGLIATKGGTRYLGEDSRWMRSVLEWVLALYAYLLFATDRLPLGTRGEDRSVVLTIQPAAQPTTGGALVRLLTSLPHLLLLCLLGVVAGLVSIVAAIAVLFTEHVPRGLGTFQRDYLVWMARMFAYHASLVDRFPPFALGPGRIPPPAGSQPGEQTWFA